MALCLMIIFLLVLAFSLLFIHLCMWQNANHKLQRWRRQSGWSGLGQTTFQQGVLRLQRQSENEMIWPGVPRKLAFALRVHISRNRSHCFAGGSRARRGPTGLHRHPRILFPQMVFAARGTLPVVDRTASAPTHFDSTSSFYCRTLSVVDPPPLLAYA